jgi:hypothetical protein
MSIGVKHLTFEQKVTTLLPVILPDILSSIHIPKIIFSPTEPTNPQENDIWIDTTET